MFQVRHRHRQEENVFYAMKTTRYATIKNSSSGTGAASTLYVRIEGPTPQSIPSLFDFQKF